MRQTTMLSEELIAKIGAGIDQLQVEPKPRQQLTLLLARLSEQIRDAQARGASYIEIAQQITASGYAIKPSTLRAGIARHRRNTTSAQPPLARTRPARPRPQSDDNEK